MSKPSVKNQCYRIIDANFNRAKEATRVAEDFCRFFLRNAKLTRDFKKIRHDATAILLRFPISYRRLVKTRDSVKDVGRYSRIQDGKNIPAWKDLMIANMKRAEEALRVLEELSKMIAPRSAGKFQKLRFRFYELEKRCLQKF